MLQCDCDVTCSVECSARCSCVRRCSSHCSSHCRLIYSFCCSTRCRSFCGALCSFTVYALCSLLCSTPCSSRCSTCCSPPCGEHCRARAEQSVVTLQHECCVAAVRETAQSKRQKRRGIWTACAPGTHRRTYEPTGNAHKKEARERDVRQQADVRRRMGRLGGQLQS